MNDIDVNRTEVEKRMKYCERVAIYMQLGRLKETDDRNVYGHVKLVPKPWDFEKYGGPPSADFLRHYSSEYDLTFDKNGCESMSAFCVENVVSPHCQFPQTDLDLVCTSSINRAVRVNYCQKNCFTSKFPLDLYWDEAAGSCRLIDLSKKIF